MKKIAGFIFFLMLFSGTLNDLFAQIDTIDWKGDIQYLKTELPKRHKNLFFKSSQEEFSKSLDNLELQVGTLTNLEVALNLQRIITRMGDSHTSADWWDYLDKNNVLSFGLVWFKDGIYIVSAEQKNRNLLGSKLISINGYPIQRIIDSLSTLIVVDNQACLKRSIPSLIYRSQLLNYFGFMPDLFKY